MSTNLTVCKHATCALWQYADRQSAYTLNTAPICLHYVTLYTHARIELLAFGVYTTKTTIRSSQ